MAGAEKSTSKGGKATLDLGALVSAARNRPDLVDDDGRKAWNLSTDGNALVFLPYDKLGRPDPSGTVRLAPGATSGDGAAGAKITIGSYKANPLALSGEFNPPKSGKKSQTLRGF
jgi:hypothetical protein